MLIKAAIRIVPFALLWWLLTLGSFESWGVGVLVVLAATAASLRLQPNGLPVSPLRLLPFAIFFLKQSIKGGVQVALLALRPRLLLRPATLDIPLRLRHEPAQVFFGSLIGLMPGTICIGLDGNRLRVHVLDRGMFAEQEVRAAEAQVARLFRVGLR